MLLAYDIVRNLRATHQAATVRERGRLTQQRDEGLRCRLAERSSAPGQGAQRDGGFRLDRLSFDQAQMYVGRDRCEDQQTFQFCK